MNTRNFLLRPFYFLTLALIFLVGCGSYSSAPVATNSPLAISVATNTPLPTATLLPTNTPVPTATPLPTNTPTPTATAVPTATPIPTDLPPTDTSSVASSATPTLVPIVREVIFDENDVQQTVLLIAQTQGIPISNDVDVQLVNGTIELESTQAIFGQKIVTRLVLAVSTANGQPTVDLVKATLNGENLPSDAVAELERTIEDGFASGLGQQIGTIDFESIIISDGQMAVRYK